MNAAQVMTAALAPAVRPSHTATRSISIRSTEMSQQLHEELARAHLNSRLEQAERARLAAHVVRVAKARRAAQRAERAAERARLRLRLLVS